MPRSRVAASGVIAGFVILSSALGISFGMVTENYGAGIRLAFVFFLIFSAFYMMLG